MKDFGRSIVCVVLVSVIVGAGMAGCGKEEEPEAGVDAKVNAAAPAVNPTNFKANEEKASENDRLAQSLIDQGKTDDAIRALTDMISKDPGRYQYLTKMAICYMKKGDLTQAETFAQKAIAIAPKASYVHRVYAEIMMSKKDYRKAEEYLQNGLTFSENDKDKAYTYGFLAALYNNEKQYAKAKENIEKALQLIPDEVHFKNALAEIEKNVK
jgi:tetratricopeptide (TPR) repeat protein